MASTSGADLESIKVDLIKSITSSWEDVVKICEENPRAHKIKISTSGNTALHIAVESGREDRVEQLVKLITDQRSEDPVGVLSVGNERGNTPLHLAASLGNIGMCKCIIGEHKQLLGNRNKKYETPLFLAARHGKKDAFFWLYEMCDSATTHDYCQSNYGSVLHCAIEGGYFDLAFQIIHKQEDLMNLVTKDGISPLHVLAGKPTAFRSGIYLPFFKKIIYHCIFVEELIPEASQEKKNLQSLQHRKKYQTCPDFLQELCKMIKLPGKSNKHLDAENPEDGQGHRSSNGAQGHQGIPSKYGRCLRFIRLIVSKTVLVILSITMPGSNKMRKLKEIKEKHVWSLQIMNKLLESAAKNEYRSTRLIFLQGSRIYKGNKYTEESPILIAARNGIVEMVEKILQVFPMAIYDTDEERGKNIVLWAVENRQSHIYDFLLKSTHFDKDLFQAKDYNEYNALDLAAKLKDYEGRFIPTSLLKMQWEAKWFEYVKNSLPPDVTVDLNYKRQSPEDIYKIEHEELLDKSKQWLNSTCNSCSFIAALIATVAFASAASVPGGVDQEDGKPIYQHHLAFRVFAISSLVALCSSFISLLIFFALLTSNYQYKDFRKNLPQKLLLGLTSFFISMAAMLLCFCSGHFLVLDDHLKYAAIPVYGLTCLAVTYFALQQFPPYVVLMKATFQNVPERIYYQDPL